MLELKLIISNGTYHITHVQFNNKVFCLKNLDETPTELRHVKRSVFMEEVNNQNLWNFEIGSEEA